ncbi:MAG TPA: 30S ribosomal protein S12 methylthiotransferase RimO [Chitinophagales bacterium]|nr:30S ribosomal protein S12 methylthiotransferase RimO [Chitinophagales bacterium]HRG28944.1 30S ribosomal protein S12 methylthiotransferase RimO [Chitinophagales bacterium]HRH55056.1 30S ribosomal protein S12 methylthiotransferase RimO [Chitinophagales bacterium]
MKARTLKKDKVNIVTLGCSKNTVDSEVLLSQLRANDVEAHHQREKDDCNIIIVNTCGFIDNAKKESIDTILNYADAKASGEIDKLYVTGCLSHRYMDELQLEIPEVDAWFGTLDLPKMLQKFNADYKHELIGERSISTPSHYAYLKISEGCNRTCSFCAIPLMRGNHVSKSIEDVIKEAKYLASIGVKEIMLIAQELTYYGLDIYKKRALADLLYELNKVDGIEWIRLHYAYPSKFPMEIIDAIKNCERVCNYLDMPLQHASDKMLKAMNRQITRAETTQLIQDIRTQIPDIGLRTTMLVGFPGETEQDIEELIAFIKIMRFERLGVFTYSHEEGTSGYLLADTVSDEEKAERASRIMEVQQQISWEKNQEKVGKVYKVIIDSKEGGNFIGRTEFDSPEVDNEVLIDASQHYLRIGDFANIKITRAEEFDLFGEPV